VSACLVRSNAKRGRAAAVEELRFSTDRVALGRGNRFCHPCDLHNVRLGVRLGAGNTLAEAPALLAPSRAYRAD